MVDLISKENCTGCKMCGDLCPKHAIRFECDNEGFWFPKINESQCIKCNLCEKKCPELTAVKKNNGFDMRCYGVKSKNNEIRWNSSSGGFFSEAALVWMEEGGTCVGAVYDADQNVRHILCEDKEDIEKLRQSKYVQSDTAEIYATVKEGLLQNKQVMFCGTPCQVAALNSFLGKTYSNLLTIDFICYGIPSPLVYKRYMEWLERKYQSKIRKIWFNNKQEGRRAIGISVEFENGKKYFRNGMRDLYIMAFVDALHMRRSCQECKYRHLPHLSDIMLGDFWGIEKVNPEFDDDKGVSAVIINSKKGLNLFDKILPRLDYFATTIEDIARGNFTIYKSKPANQNRGAFLAEVEKSSLSHAMRKYSSYSGIERISTDAHYYLAKIKEKIKHFKER